jgi:hypothetical protein
LGRNRSIHSDNWRYDNIFNPTTSIGEDRDLSTSGRFVLFAFLALVVSIAMVAVGLAGAAEIAAEISYWLLILELLSSLVFWILRRFRGHRGSA